MKVLTSKGIGNSVRAMRFVIFVVLIFVAILVSGVYGALHDQISFTVSAEYFTKFKFQQFGFTGVAFSNRMSAACIGFLATWWMGLPIGLFVGAFSFLHRTPREMFIRTLKSYAVVAFVALLVGILGLSYGWFFASHEVSDYIGWYIPKGLEFQRNFFAVGYMHNFSYLGGLIGLVFGIVAQFVQRQK